MIERPRVLCYNCIVFYSTSPASLFALVRYPLCNVMICKGLAALELTPRILCYFMKCFLLNFFTAERLAGEEAERLAGKENIITDIQRDEPTRRTYGMLVHV
jgi:hypothetical protein